MTSISYSLFVTPLRRLAALGAFLCLASGCNQAPPGTAAQAAAPASAAGKEVPDKEPADKDVADAGVTLTPDQVQKMGIIVAAAQAARYTPQAIGYAQVMAHENLAQGVAELVSAQAVAKQSRAALARIEKLAGTPGAMPADAEESAARQAAVDEAALMLAHQRLSAVFGQHPPWAEGDMALMRELADGKIKLVRVTFPLGTLEGGAPQSLRLTHLNESRTQKGWQAGTVWDAPADANVPGRSFFALLKGSDAGEGERLMAFAPIGAPVAGVLIPESALVISAGQGWCYVERKPGVFERVAIDTHQPQGDGYFMSSGLAAGDRIVTAAAGLLLARESNAGAAAD
jgi:hypothetical protein